MHRAGFTLLSAGLMLGGCVAAGPCDYDPAACYPYGPPPAPQPQPPPQPAPYPYPYSYGYPSGPAPAQAYVGPDGITYVNGYPVDVIDNQQVELVFVPAYGGWGYYDGGHEWRGAAPDMRDRLDRFHPQGRGLPPQGGFRPGGGPGQEPGRGPGQAGDNRGPSRQAYPGPGSGPGPYGGNRPVGSFQGRPPEGRQPQGQQYQGRAPQGRAPGGPAPERREAPRGHECKAGQQRC